jgi:hypothetical protein
MDAHSALSEIRRKKIFGVELKGGKAMKFAFKPCLRNAQLEDDAIVLPDLYNANGELDFFPAYPYLFFPNFRDLDISYIGSYAHDALKFFPKFRTIEEKQGDQWELLVEREDGVKFLSRSTALSQILANIEVNPGIRWGELLGIFLEKADEMDLKDEEERKEVLSWIEKGYIAPRLGMLWHEADLIDADSA